MSSEPITPTRLEKLQALFEETLEQPPESRTTFLNSRVPDDNALREEVLALIRAHERDESGFRSPLSPSILVDAATGEDRRMGSRVGAYQVTRVIGVGGMGAVYEAVRADDQFQKRAAVKFLHRNSGSESALTRFRAERQILANLNHPNIAVLLDGGVTDDGQPYIVMEYVDGSPITTWCDDRKLGIDERLELFTQVCAAVQSAHRSLIVHRDLKPGNILVDNEGRVKLLDFGIARFLNPDTDASSMPTTLSGQRSFTPDYASPEQLSGRTVDTRADVYALGVVLFELLAGRRPFDLNGKSIAEVERIVSSVEAPRPSSLIDEARSSMFGDKSASRTRSAIQGDLDAIVGMALRKEPERRYGSADLMSADIRNYLDGRPVLARPDGMGYRMQKLVRRRKLETAALTVAVISLIGGLVGTTIQARRAAAQGKRAEQVTGFVTTMLGAADPGSLGKDVTVREVLDSAAAHVDTLASNPDLEAEIRTVIGGTYMGLGEFEAGEAQYRKALDARRRRAPDGDHATVVTLTQQSYALEYLGDYAAADSVLVVASKLNDRFPPSNPLDRAEFLDQRARIATRLGHNDEAETLQEEALDITKRAAPGNDTLLAYAYGNLGFVKSELGKVAESEKLYEAGVAATRRAYGDHHTKLAEMLSPYATVLDRAGKPAQADSVYRLVLDMRRKLLGEDHPEYAWTMFNYSDWLRTQKRYPEAAEWARKVLALRGKTLPDSHMAVATAMGELGRALGHMDSLDVAEKWLRESLELRRRNLPKDHWLVASSESILGEHFILAHQYSKAEKLLLPSEAKLTAALGENAPIVADARGRLVALYQEWGKPDEAARWQKKIKK
jgi:serine/threonine-protein kinase